MKSLSWELKRLLMAEIDNEAEGGESPATLGTALGSLRQGYNPDPDHRIDMAKVEAELTALIEKEGLDALAEDRVSSDDWRKRLQRVRGYQANPEDLMPTRTVEYFRCWSDGTWDTDFIAIPADTPDERLDDEVRAAASKINWAEEAPQIVGCYYAGDDVDAEWLGDDEEDNCGHEY